MSGLEIRSINCTSCGAGLSVLGGGRVRTQVCEYCGSVLDVQENFKVLSEFGKLPRPSTPFSIGMTGEIDGIGWTIIGILGVEERYGGSVWGWVDHQMYSPTHGYCWLTFETGHYVFTRKVRGPGAQGWISSARVEKAEHQPTTMRDGKPYRYYESGRQRISYAEGSFNWIPKRGDSADYTSFLGDTEMLTQVFGANEKEVELSHYLSPEVVETAFGLSDLPRSARVHPLEPLVPWKHGTFTRNLGLGAAAVGVVMWAMQLTGSQVVLHLPEQSTARPIEAKFELSDAQNLTELRFTSNANNAWAWYDIELVGPGGETVAEFGRQAEYYQGREGGESWSEGSGTATARLRLEEPGSYTLLIEQSDAGTWGGGRRPSSVSVRVTEGRKAAYWLLIAAGFCALAGVAVMGRRYLHGARRWSGSDWSDDD